MASARVKIPLGLSGLLKDDFVKVIEQANLGLENTQIAKMYLIDAIPQMDIAVALCYDRSTITKRLQKIVARTALTARQMGFPQ